MPGSDTFTARPGEASYAVLAHVLNAAYSPKAPVTRNRVYEWAKHSRLNKAGQPFPQPSREVPEGERRHGQPSRFWNAADVVRWYAGGVAEAGRDGG